MYKVSLETNVVYGISVWYSSDEGGFEYKRAVVETMIHIINEIPQAQESGLSHLCEFIEDCEFTVLSAQVLHLLGKLGPHTPSPSKYIRYIYNRVILENSTVRAAAVSALAKFGAVLEDIRPNIKILLTRCLYDNDDEVRDRATFYLHILSCDSKISRKYIVDDIPLSIPGLERALLSYRSSPEKVGSAPFDMKTVPLAVNEAVTAGLGGMAGSEANKENMVDGLSGPGAKEAPGGSAPGRVNASSMQEEYARELSTIPEFASYGPLFKSSRVVALTEAETEYNVGVVKHVFNDHVVFQYNLLNTLNDQQLENVSVITECSEDWEIDQIVECDILAYDSPQKTYVSYVVTGDTAELSATFSNTLKFIVKGL